MRSAASSAGAVAVFGRRLLPVAVRSGDGITDDAGYRLPNAGVAILLRAGQLDSAERRVASPASGLAQVRGAGGCRPACLRGMYGGCTVPPKVRSKVVVRDWLVGGLG
jgi:hypothetical protein